MKIWLITLLLCISALAWGESAIEDELEESVEGWEAAGPLDPNAPPINWVDSSHAYASEQTQALAEWMDGFFGVPNYDVEQPESLVRLQWTNSWDQDDDYSDNLRLRGKVQLPAVSKRLNLVFSGEDGDELDLDENETRLDDSVGLLYELSQGDHSRFDLTMGISFNHLRPGARYRYQNTLSKATTFRFTQRAQYESSEGFYATSQLELNRALSENNILRWNNRAVYGEETDGTEWLTRVSLFQRRRHLKRHRQLGINYFGAIKGVTSPESYVKNYRVGVLFRRQIYRKFLFLELEPAYNYRKRKPEDNREFAWSIALRLEIALSKDLQRVRSKRKAAKQAEAAMDTDSADDVEEVTPGP